MEPPFKTTFIKIRYFLKECFITLPCLKDFFLTLPCDRCLGNWSTPVQSYPSPSFDQCNPWPCDLGTNLVSDAHFHISTMLFSMCLLCTLSDRHCVLWRYICFMDSFPRLVQNLDSRSGPSPKHGILLQGRTDITISISHIFHNLSFPHLCLGSCSMSTLPTSGSHLCSLQCSFTPLKKP